MKPSNLAKNATFYTVALATQKALSFLYFILVARMIHVESVGKLSFALSFTTIFAMVLDLGLTQVIIRESARNQDNAKKYLSNIIGLKIIGSFLIYGIVAVLINLMGYPAITRELVYVSGLVMILDSFALSFYGVLRGYQVLKYESLGVVSNQLLVMASGIVVLVMGWGLVPLMLAYLVGSLFNFLFSASLLSRKANMSLKPQWQKTVIWQLFKLALPFAIAGIFIRLYSYMDVVLLSKLATDVDLGYYSVAYKAAFSLQFIGVGSLASIYPAFSSYYVNSREMLAKSFTRVLYFLLMTSMPISVGVIVIADYIIGPIFGARYAGSIMPLQIMMTAIPLAFLCFPVGAMLNACNRQNTNTVILGLTALTNIILNLILIPFYGYIGSALAVPLSYLVLLGGGLMIVNKIVKYDKKYLLIVLAKIIASCLLMALAVLYLRDHYHIIISIAAGALVYIAAIFLLRGATKEDLRGMAVLIFRK